MKNEEKFSKKIEELKEKISRDDLIMVLGGMDTGKTTLTRGLLETLGGKVIDTDPGQPGLGPPGLITSGSYAEGVEDAYFVGDFTPRGNLVEVITGVAKVEKGSGRPCFVDTDGWVEGGAAGAYKGGLISLLEPDLLLLLERGCELEAFASYLPPEKVVRYEIGHMGEKTQGERAANRVRKLKYYFSQGRTVRKSWSEVRFAGTLIGNGEDVSEQLAPGIPESGPVKAWRTGNQLTVLSGSREEALAQFEASDEITKVNHHPIEDLAYRFVGCYQGSRFTGIGTVTDVTRKGIEVLTTGTEFDLVKLGKVRVRPSGRTIS